MSKKILICVNQFKNFYLFRRELIEDLLIDNKIYLVGEFDGFETEFQNNKSLRLINVNFDSNGLSIIKSIKTIIKLYSILKVVKPTRVLTFTIKPNLFLSFLNFFFNYKIIVNVSGLGTMFITEKWKKYLSLFLFKIIFYKKYFVLFQNNKDMSMFIKYKITNEKNSLRIPGSGIKPNIINPKTHINKERKVIFVGRLIIEKGILEYINSTTKIIKELSSKELKIRFYIAGDHDVFNPRSINENHLNDWLNQENCFYLGNVKDISKYLYQYDLLVLPSYREGLSRALLEACNNGLPIITSKVPGCEELCSFKNGILISPASDEALKDALLSYLSYEDHELLKMGNNGYENVINMYSIDEIIKIYKELIL